MLCNLTHSEQGKVPYATEAEATAAMGRSRSQSSGQLPHQRTDKAKRVLNVYQCADCKLWFIGTPRANAVPPAELRAAVERHTASHDKRRAYLRAQPFNTPRIAA
jgi:hypothetical protein